MHGLEIDGGLHFRRDLPMPDPAADEALIRVRRAGICGTDLELLDGYKRFRGIPGHEFVGAVVDAPDGRWIGRRVCAEINLACGACSLCLRGLPSHCERRTVLGIMGRDGAFAQYIAVPLRNLHPVPDGVDDDLAVFVEPLAAAFEILEQIRVGRDDRVLVLGDGKLGLLCAMVMAPVARTVAAGRHGEKLSILRRLGIETAAPDDLDDSAFDVVVEATGSPEGIETAMRVVRPRGAIALKSTTVGEAAINLSTAVVKEVSIVGSRCGPFPPALAALERGDIDPRPLIAARYPLERGEEAFRAAARRGTLKVILDVVPSGEEEESTHADAE